MSYTETIKMEDWLEERKKVLIATPANRRPRNTERPIISRTWSERKAMARAVQKAWDDAIKSGLLVKTEKGYRLN